MVDDYFNIRKTTSDFNFDFIKFLNSMDTQKKRNQRDVVNFK